MGEDGGRRESDGRGWGKVVGVGKVVGRGKNVCQKFTKNVIALQMNHILVYPKALGLGLIKPQARPYLRAWPGLYRA